MFFSFYSENEDSFEYKTAYERETRKNHFT
jgi:hypothetical protein